MPSTLYDHDYRLFVQHLIELRGRVGMTQEQLADLLGKPQSYISKSERFERRIDVAEFGNMVRALGLNPVDEFSAVMGIIHASAELSAQPRFI